MLGSLDDIAAIERCGTQGSIGFQQAGRVMLLLSECKQMLSHFVSPVVLGPGIVKRTEPPQYGDDLSGVVYLPTELPGAVEDLGQGRTSRAKGMQRGGEQGLQCEFLLHTSRCLGQGREHLQPFGTMGSCFLIG